MSRLLVAHIADTQLDTVGHALDPETGLNAVLMRRYRCFRYAVEDAVGRGASLILHAGDLFDGPKPTPTVRRLAIDALAPALEQGIPVIVILGNHDLPQSAPERNALDPLQEVEGVTVVDRPQVLWYCLDEEHGIPFVTPVIDFVPADQIRAAVACLPWPSKSWLLADEEARGLDPVAVNQLMREKVCEVVAGLAAETAALPGARTILLAHVMVEGSVAGSESRLMSMGRQWTVPLSAIEGPASPLDAATQDSPWEYVALGHVHRPQYLGRRAPTSPVCDEVSGPIIRYSGSPEAIDFGEEFADEDHGYTVVEWREEPERDFHDFSVTHTPTPHTQFVTIAPGEPLPPGTYPERAVVRVKGAPGQAIDAVAEAQRLGALGVADCRIDTQPPEREERTEPGLPASAREEDHLRAWCGREGGDAKEREDDVVAAGMEIIQAVSGEQ